MKADGMESILWPVLVKSDPYVVTSRVIGHSKGYTGVLSMCGEVATSSSSKTNRPRAMRADGFPLAL